MKVIGFAGYSGAGKTTLVEQLIGRLKASGQRVSVVKHAHHKFDIDHEGKDSWRHRQAGAYEVVIASDRRLAKIREYEVEADPSVHELIAELSDCDWVLVEGFKHADLCKLEVWRAPVEGAVLYPTDPRVVAVVTDDRGALPAATHLPVFDLNDPAAIVDFLMQTAGRYEYTSPRSAPAADAYAGAGAGAVAGGRPAAPGL